MKCRGGNQTIRHVGNIVAGDLSNGKGGIQIDRIDDESGRGVVNGFQ